MTRWTPSEAARTAGDYFNSLPFEERKKLAPLLDEYRQMGMAEALDRMYSATQKVERRIHDIQSSGYA